MSKLNKSDNFSYNNDNEYSSQDNNNENDNDDDMEEVLSLKPEKFDLNNLDFNNWFVLS